MRAKEYLLQVRRLEVMIRQKFELRASLRSALYDVGAVGTGAERVQGGDPKGFEDAVAEIDAITAEIAEMTAELAAVKREVLDKIQRLRPVYADVLYKRYLENKPYWKIAADMDYSTGHVKRLHREALAEMDGLVAIAKVGTK